MGSNPKSCYSPKLGICARDKNNYFGEGELKNNLTLERKRTFTLKGTRWCLLNSICNLLLNFQWGADVSTINNYFIIILPKGIGILNPTLKVFFLTMSQFLVLVDVEGNKVEIQKPLLKASNNSLGSVVQIGKYMFHPQDFLLMNISWSLKDLGDKIKKTTHFAVEE